MLLKHLPVLFAAALVTTSAAFAEGAKGEGSVGYRLSYYNHADSDGTDGNPFLNEELDVVEPVIVFDYNVADGKQVWGKLSYDWVSSASIDRLSKFPEQSGATGDYYVGLDLGYRNALDDTRTLGYNGHISVEYDYVSAGLGTDYSFERASGSAVNLGLNAFIDTIDIIRYNGSQSEGTDTRLTATASAGLYQTYSPEMHGEYGAVLTFQNGFLETPYNAVVIEDGSGANPNLVNNAPGREVTEELDDTRLRAAVYGRLRKKMTELGSGQVGGRLYNDTWGITGITFEPRWYQWLREDAVLLRLRYRYYTQTAADDYAESFASEPTLRTQDSDLSDFSGHTVGAKAIFYTSDNSSIDVGFDYTVRSDDLNYFMTGFGYKRTF